MTATSGHIGRTLDDIRRGGAGVLLHKLAKAAGAVFWPGLAILLYPFVIALRPVLLIRFTPIPSKRLGHLSLRSAFYLAERQAGLQPKKSLDFFYLRPAIPSNRALASILARSMRFGQWARHFHRIYQRLPGGKAHEARVASMDFGDMDGLGLLTRTGPGVALTPEETAEGWRILGEQGVPEGAPFICFHARDSRYVTELDPGKRENLEARHTYRNADVMTYLPALEALSEQGHYAFRMGAIVDRALPEIHPRVIDYATRFRSDLMDIFLISNCRFMISNGSGPDGVAELFRRPVVFVDFAACEQLHSSFPHVSIFKRYWRVEDERYMTMREILASGVGWYLPKAEMDARGIRPIDNTPEEILEATLEMDARLDGSWVSEPEDVELQERFWAIFGDHRLHRHRQGWICAAFLRRHRDLLD